ncbi:hypothetical protein [Oleispirillum naphthae]|uniref:hypothetical protein n=1 Tax=Oleispirillum naphthae TaxID=2838853 RepID=UPI0030823B1B
MWFGFLKRDDASVAVSEPMDIPWEKNDKGRFWKLLMVRPSTLGIAGRGGVAAFFHRGVKPGWVFVCATDDLGALLDAAQDDKGIMDYEARGGVYVTWSFVKPEFREGVARHLRDVLRPEVADSGLDGHRAYAVEAVPVNPPN